MKLFKILLLGMLLALTSCSSKKTEDADSDTAEVAQEDSDFIVDADDEDLVIDETEGEEEEMLASAEESIDEAVDSAPVEMTGNVAEYTIKKGETLMMVAFQIYGDYRKWKELSEMNQVSSTQLRAGMTIRYNQPESAFVWNPDGLPYLIKMGDTLGTIAEDKYGTAGKWRKIYNNNRPLIKDPNLIFAGFTLYYVSERDLASE